MQRQVLRPGIDLDPGNHAGGGQPVDEPGARPVALPDSLVEQDRAADMDAKARRRHEQLAVGTPGLFGLRDAGRVEAPVAGRDALIHCQQTLAAPDKRLRGGRQTFNGKCRDRGIHVSRSLLTSPWGAHGHR